MKWYFRFAGTLVAWSIGLMVLMSSPVTTTNVGTEYNTDILRSQNQAKLPVSGPITIVDITNDVLMRDAKRFGINIGSHSPYGSAQILKNIVPNPGFEGSEYGMVFLAQPGSDGGRVQADHWQPSWNDDALRRGFPQGFWNGAQYEVVSGAAKWRTGTVSVFAHDDDANTFYLQDVGTAPQRDDAIFVRQQVGGYKLDYGPNHRAESAETRPGSPGTQSLRLYPPSQPWQPSWGQPFDTYFRDQDQGASKFLIADGSWDFSIWARATKPGDTLRIVFQRFGEAIFVEETVGLTDQWTLIERRFEIPAGSDPLPNWQADMPRNGLSLELHLASGSADVLVDDIVMQRSGQSNPTEFSDKFVGYLRELQPGILRNWGAQLGSSLDNQLAVPSARKMTGSNPKYRVAKNFHYSLHDFLTLSQLVGAEPWYVIPPTFSRDDLSNLSAYLSAPAGTHPYADLRASLGQPTPWTDLFSQVHLEYGNEIWGENAASDPFLGATLRGGTRAGEIASDRFGILKGGPFFSAEKVNLVIGGQSAFPARQGEIARASSNHNSIGIAPYFANGLDFFGDTTTLYQSLYAHPQQSVRASTVTQSMQEIAADGRSTNTAVYEINLHTLTGNMDLNLRNVFLSGQGASLALPLTMMTYQSELGIRDLIPYQALQFSTLMPDRFYARVFGLLRDLEATGRKRPTWLATELANRAIRPTMLKTGQSGANPTFTAQPGNGIATPQTVTSIQSFAYRDAGSVGIALYNLDINTAHAVELRLPEGIPAPATATLHKLEAETVFDTNEDWPKVALQSESLNDFANGYQLMLAPHSMVVIEWGQRDAITAVPSQSAAATVSIPAQPPEPVLEAETALPERPAPVIGSADSFAMDGFNMSANVLANDQLTVGFTNLGVETRVVQKPQHGAIWLNPNGQFTYTPQIGFTGVDSFTYQVAAGDWVSAEISVSIDVRSR